MDNNISLPLMVTLHLYTIIEEKLKDCLCFHILLFTLEITLNFSRHNVYFEYADPRVKPSPRLAVNVVFCRDKLANSNSLPY